jgi:hypothetical protein
MSECSLDTTAGAPSAGGGGGAEVTIDLMRDGTTLWEYDFANEPNQNIPAGTFSLDPATWPLNSWTGQVAAASTFAFQSGVGLRYISSHSASTSFTGGAGAQTASLIYLPLSTVFSTFDIDPRVPLLYQIQISSQTYTISGEETSVGFWKPAATPTAADIIGFGVTVRGLQVGVNVSRMHVGTSTSSNYTTAPGPTADVLSTLVTPSNVATGYIGVWAGSFEDTHPLTMILANSQSLGAGSGVCNHMLSEVSRLTIAFPTVVTAGAHDVTVRRVRLAIPFFR